MRSSTPRSGCLIPRAQHSIAAQATRSVLLGLSGLVPQNDAVMQGRVVQRCTVAWLAAGSSVATSLTFCQLARRFRASLNRLHALAAHTRCSAGSTPLIMVERLVRATSSLPIKSCSANSKGGSEPGVSMSPSWLLAASFNVPGRYGVFVRAADLTINDMVPF